jgi:hypothetical protein
VLSIAAIEGEATFDMIFLGSLLPAPEVTTVLTQYCLLGAAIDGEGSNVLVFNCTSSIRTKDLDEIVEPFSREGSCTIRWIDDIKALAVFSSSTTGMFSQLCTFTRKVEKADG